MVKRRKKASRMVFIKTGGEKDITYHLPGNNVNLGITACGLAGTPISKTTKPAEICQECKP